MDVGAAPLVGRAQWRQGGLSAAPHFPRARSGGEDLGPRLEMLVCKVAHPAGLSWAFTLQSLCCALSHPHLSGVVAAAPAWVSWVGPRYPPVLLLITGGRPGAAAGSL